MSNELQLNQRAETTYSPIVARVPIVVRAGTMDDLPFIDRLQKAHSRELGFLPTAALAGKVKLGQVLVAETVADGESASRQVVEEQASAPSSRLADSPTCRGTPVGYLIAADRYQKRDEIGYVTQINVVPEYRRHLVAAQLLQAQFDRSAYGCRLYSCWCAQDLKANEFWEAMGFTPIAFRTGSMTKGRSGRSAVGSGQGRKSEPSDSSSSVLPTAHCLPPTSRARVHIFWQKRIRAGDTGDLASGGTPWWYPSQTGGGEIREDRLVFPILPGVHWRDVRPIVLESSVLPTSETPKPLPDAASEPSTGEVAVESVKPKRRSKKKEPAPPVALTKTVLVSPTRLGGFWFPEQGVAKEVPLPPEERPAEAPVEAIVEKPKRAKAVKEKTKIDPRLTAMSRELRDRWGERNEAIPALPGRHDVCRRIESDSGPAWRTTPMVIEASPMRALPSAA